MPITLACPSCKKPLAVADNQAGATVACPSCKAHLRVPGKDQVAQSSDTAAARTTAMPGSTSSSTATQATARRASTPRSCNEWVEVDALLGEAVEVIDRPPTNQEEAQVRAGLTTYSNSIPHHQHQNLGHKITITTIREYRAYRVVLDSLFEKRNTVRKVEPFQGGNVPTPKTTEQNIHVWSYPYATASEFRKGTKENMIEDSKGLRTCQTCGGQKATSCSGCSGSGAVACSECGGGGTVSCLRCSGNAFIQVKTGTQQKWVMCGMCVGSGRKLGSPQNEDHRCMACAGNGRVPQDEDVYQAVPCPCGNGRVRCYTCEGHTKVRCSKCTGTGKLTCTTCQGKGQMLSFLCVVQTFEPHSETISVPLSRMKDQTISSMMQQNDHSAFLTLTTANVPPTLNLTRGIETLRGGIQKAFDAAKVRVSVENRLTRQRLQVTAASVIEVVYEHEGIAYTAWFVGKEFRLHAPVNPITDALKLMVQEAVNTWKKGEQKEAAARLNDITKMAKAHPSCQAVFDEVRGTIPTDLASKAKWLKWKPWVIAGAIILALSFIVNMIVIFTKPGREKESRPPGFQKFEKPGGDRPKLK